MLKFLIEGRILDIINRRKRGTGVKDLRNDDSWYGLICSGPMGLKYKRVKIPRLIEGAIVGTWWIIIGYLDLFENWEKNLKLGSCFWAYLSSCPNATLSQRYAHWLHRDPPLSLQISFFFFFPKFVFVHKIFKFWNEVIHYISSLIWSNFSNLNVDLSVNCTTLEAYMRLVAT